MTLPLKPRVITPVTRIINKTQSVTANVAFEDIDLTINGEGSEIYDYEGLIVCHSLGSIKMRLNNLTSYNLSYMKGTPSSAVAYTGEQSELSVGSNNGTESIVKFKITGHIGNKRHIQLFRGDSDGVLIASYFTTDTVSELTSIQLYSSVNDDLDYTCLIYAKPKLQYNHEAIHFKRETWTAQSDTRTVSGFSGEDYDVVVESDMDTSVSVSCLIRVNGDATGNRPYQQIRNDSGTINSYGASTASMDAYLSSCSKAFINGEIGRKKLTFAGYGKPFSSQQFIRTTWNPDTTTEFTTLDLTPSGTITGHIDVYLVPKCYNDTIIPFEFRQIIKINGNFSAGQTVEIPSWASFIRVRTLLNGASGFTSIRGDFNGVGQTCNTQYLRALSTAASASTGSDSYVTLGRVDLLAKSEFIMNLESGYNRPALLQASQDEDEMRFYYESVQDTVSTFTNVKIYASNTNTLQGEIVVDFI